MAVSKETLDDLLKLTMLALFCDFNNGPPIDTKLDELEAEFERVIDEAKLRESPQYLAAKAGDDTETRRPPVS